MNMPMYIAFPKEFQKQDKIQQCIKQFRKKYFIPNTSVTA